MTDKVYVVVCYGGEWDDAWEHNVKAFSTQEKAEALVQELEQSIPEYSEYIARLEERIHRIAIRKAESQLDCLPYTSDEWEIYEQIFDSIAEPLFEKMSDRYPHLTGDPYGPDCHYMIREIEYGG